MTFKEKGYTMALLTLLTVVNSTLDQMDGFRVATIDDTIESQQIASICEKVYNDLSNDVFSSDVNQTLLQLDALADSAKPNYLKLPAGIIHVVDNKVMYNISEDVSGLDMQEIDYLPPQEFLDLVGARDDSLPNSQIVTDFSGYKMVILNKKAPQHYTDFDDEFLVFDAFDSDVDSTLQSSKSGVIATVQGTFTPSDSYVIDFPEFFHTTYLNAVIAEASAVLREEPIFHAARLARTGIIKAKRQQRIGIEDRRLKRYGR